MTDPESVLVGGDEQERRTRETYGTWMRHGLEVVERVAARTTGAGWPPGGSIPELSRTPWAPRSYGSPDAVRDALANGWLVARAPADLRSPTALDGAALSGLSVAVKDIIDVAGLPTHNGTAGAPAAEPARSAPAWSLLVDAGARCVGKAATHEMAWGVTTPQIANPLAGGRIAGGSSGGSAACVAAGAAQGALGTDTGGSIRIPAALCGVVGFRPTTGRVPVAGITPLAPAQDAPGPIAADVSTCTAMLEVLLARGLASEQDGPAGLRIGVLADPGRLQPEVRRAYERVLDLLGRAGAEVIACETRLHREAGSVSLVTMLLESAGLHAAAVRAAPASFGGQARALLTLGEPLGSHAALVRSARTSLAAQTAAVFDDARLDAFLTPTVPCVAPERGAETVTVEDRDEPVTAALTRFTAWASVAAMPAISVPVAASGLPVGVQVMTRPDHEHVCARLAREIEALDSRPDLGCDE